MERPDGGCDMMERHDMTVTGRTPNERDKIYCPIP